MPQENFSAILIPHRSLGRHGFFILMGLICGISFIAGVVFFKIGAWPVVGFFGLDVLLIYGAFKLNYRDARQREIIEINGEELRVTKLNLQGRAKSWQFNRYWVRVQHYVDPEEEYENQPLIITSHGRALEIGSFLSRNEKIVFSNRLRDALKSAGNGWPAGL